MKYVGLDYASRGYSAAGLVKDGEAIATAVFKPDARQDESDPQMLVQYARWLTFKLALWKPDVVIVEHLAVFQNKNVIRALSHREGICLYIAKTKCPIVIHRRIGSARAVVFGNGAISKDAAWTARTEHIDYNKFKKKTAGGTDEMDALTLALAASVLMERA